MAAIAKAGGKCAGEAITVALVGGVISIIGGGVGTTLTTPIGGGAIGIGGIGITAIVDLCLYMLRTFLAS